MQHQPSIRTFAHLACHTIRPTGSRSPTRRMRCSLRSFSRTKSRC
ncbi:hypothetical protein M3J09_009586 [Ascochyta lentis]